MVKPSNMYQVIQSFSIALEAQNYGQKLVKMAIKHKNDDFLVITLKYVNRLATPKLWGIAHENGHKS